MKPTGAQVSALMGVGGMAAASFGALTSIALGFTTFWPAMVTGSFIGTFMMWRAFR